MLLWLCSLDFPALAQSDSIQAIKPYQNIFVEYKQFYGTVMDHRQTLGWLVRDNLHATQISVLQQTKGNRYWHQLFGYPEVGVGLYFINLRNPEHLGYIFGAYPMAQWRISGNERSRLSFNLGVGLGYISKPFDEKENYQFVSLGSHVNGLYNLSFAYHIWLTQKFGLIADAGVTHLSNATMKSPNLGLNILSVRMGLRYKITSETSFQTLQLPNHENRIALYIFGALGSRQLQAPGGINYWVSSILVQARKSFTHKHAMVAGLDWFYDGSVQPRLEEQGYTYKNAFSNTYGGLHVGYALSMGKLVINLQQGVFLYSYFKQPGPVYQRLGLQYFLTEKLIANITFKTYFAYAEFIEWGVGYRLGYLTK